MIKIISKISPLLKLHCATHRNFYRTSKIMFGMDVVPPVSVRGMTVLDKDKFNQVVELPMIQIPNEKLNDILKIFKKFLLKLSKFKPVRDNPNNSDSKLIVLDPVNFKSSTDLEKIIDDSKHITNISLNYNSTELTYDNWSHQSIFKAVLPENNELSSYSIIGHIIHLNLKDCNLPFKKLIGEVLLDKVPQCNIVINKTNSVDNVYRTFMMEVLAGEGDTITSVSENGVSFKLDFSKVFWNPRLSHEHSIIVSKINHRDVLFDVMAGIGPFSVPAAKKKKAIVFANDLNPISFKYLVENCSNNKVLNRVSCYNKDAEEFIKTIVKNKLVELWNDENFEQNIHITMNLPAKAVEFLPSFIGLLSDVATTPNNDSFPNIFVHVYMFCSKSDRETCMNVLYEHFMVKDLENKGTLWVDDAIDEIISVRNVSNNKFMMRASIKLPLHVLIKQTTNSNGNCDLERPSKCLKLDHNN